MAKRAAHEEAFRRFVQDVWARDVAPLLRGADAGQRRTTARAGGKLAGATGMLLDRMLGLRGRPFGRAMTVLGASLGAMLPDLWDWSWLRKRASEAQRRVVDEQMRRRAAGLGHADGLALFGLAEDATREALRDAWHDLALRWHPDKAPDDEIRNEFRARFAIYETTYERLCAAFDRGELPRSGA